MNEPYYVHCTHMPLVWVMNHGRCEKCQRAFEEALHGKQRSPVEFEPYVPWYDREEVDA